MLKDAGHEPQAVNDTKSNVCVGKYVYDDSLYIRIVYISYAWIMGCYVVSLTVFGNNRIVVSCFYKCDHIFEGSLV